MQHVCAVAQVQINYRGCRTLVLRSCGHALTDTMIEVVVGHTQCLETKNMNSKTGLVDCFY